MKKLESIAIIFSILCSVTTISCFAQWQQKGGDINGEAAGDISGQSASLSADGIIVAIGAPSNSGSQINSFIGHVRVFEYNANNWVQKGNDIDGEVNGDFSGNPVSIDADGTTVAIGAFNNDSNGRDSGHVRVFEFNNSDWVQKGNDIDGEFEGDLSGGALSINGIGTIIAIGAANNNGNGVAAGHVRVYEFNTGNWVQKGNDIDGESAFDNSGNSVSLSNNGNIVAIGASRNDGNGSNAGHVRVYEFTAGNWVQKGNDIDGEAANDQSGNSISLNADGTIVAIGAILNDGNGLSSGHVRIYEFTANSWLQKGLDIDGEFAGDRSGSSIDINADGTIMAVGADANNGNGALSGHVRIYEFINGNWVKKDNDIDGEASQDRSGSSVSLSSNGAIVAVGAPNNSENGSNAGHVRIFTNTAVLGINETSFLNENILLFPNPSFGEIKLHAKNAVLVTSIRLMDSNGKTLHTQEYNCSTCSFDTRAYKNRGLYFLKIDTTLGAVVKKIIIKN